MAQNVLKFTSITQSMPDKRLPDERIGDFAEIYAEFDPERARQQSSRCSQCGIPFCSIHCPLSNNIPDWLMLTAEGRLEEAYEISQATNNFPEICGRICPQDRLCEGNCVIEKGFSSVTIGSVEKYITDTAWERGWVKPAMPVRDLGHSIAVIGAGPGGLAAAEQLRRKGYEVHVYDRYDRVGGLLVYGIPNFKLDKEIVRRRHELLAAAGINFHTGIEIGRDLTLADLRHRHAAVLIATGVYKSRELMVPGVGLDGVVPALDFLTASNRKGLGDTVPAFEDGSIDAAGKIVVVIGGGDTAMDCVRTAVRQGAKSVTCLYRRDRANMPGSQREVHHAEEEGVIFSWLSAPEAVVGRDTGGTGERAVELRVHRLRLGAPDSSGRQAPHLAEDGHFSLPADLVIKALGFDPEDVPTLFAEPDLKVSRWGTVSIDHRTMMTSLDGVFAAGDIVRGASLVVWAIRDGRDAAEAIHRYVTGQGMVGAVGSAQGNIPSVAAE